MENQTFITGKVVAYNIDFGFGTVKTEEHGELIFSKEQAEKGTSFRESQAVFLKVKQSKTGNIEIVSISDKTFQAEDVTLNKETTIDEIGTFDDEIIYLTKQFLKLDYIYQKKDFLEKIPSIKKERILEKCSDLGNEDDIFNNWWSGFTTYKPSIIYLANKFIDGNYTHKRKDLFGRISDNEQSEILKICEKKENEKKIFDIWLEGYNIDIKLIILSKNNEQIMYQIKQLTDVEKEKIINIFTQESCYKILLWSINLIDEFDFKNYALNYFRLNTYNKRLFTKKVKPYMKEAFDAKQLKTLDSWQKVREEADGTTIYEATWRCVWFGNKYLQICMDSSEGILSHRYFWEYADEKFNLLAEYISGRRVEPLTVYYKNGKIEEIDGLGVLEETIYKAYIEQEVREGRGGKIFKGEGVPKMPVNMLLRNTCVRYLNLLQIPALEPTQVFEITTYDTDKNKKMDISVLFSIELPHGEVAVIWESLELEKSKATHLFKYAKQHHEEMFANIQSHIEMISYIRSKLRSSQSEDVKMQTKLAYYGNIDHDNLDFEIWRNKLHKTLPTLPIPTNYRAILEV